MKRKGMILGLGIACVGLIAAAAVGETYYGLAWPVWVAVPATLAYVAWLVWLAIQQNRRWAASPETRRISSWLGLFGLLGFLGFGGILTYRADGTFFPFAFFAFFGFFAFYFEGRMAGVLRDEMYEHNATRARAKAMQIGMLLTIFSLIFTTWMPGLEAAFLFLYIAVSLIWGLTMFLVTYLLYRYDQKG